MSDPTDDRVYVTLRDVYDLVAGLSKKMDDEADTITRWQTRHELHDTTRFAELGAGLQAVNVQLAVQEKAVTTALTAVNEARDKAELAVDKRFEKVDTIARNLENAGAGLSGKSLGSQITTNFIFGVITAAAAIVGAVYLATH